MKRKGYVYDRMSDWSLIKAAESVSVKGKGNRRGVMLHKKYWLRNLVEIQENVESHMMHTGLYVHMNRVSGRGKMRDIAKLKFHPSHIQHQLLVMASDREIDRRFFRHTYASRMGFGQHRGALRLNRWVQKVSRDNGEYQWYLQLDIRKYYASIPHAVVQRELERIYKDREFIETFMEPVRTYSDTGIGIPLGIRPSQIMGNLALASFDRFVKEELKCRYYVRYLDDSVMLCRSRAEAKVFAKRSEAFLKTLSFDIHEPRIDKVVNGIDFLGYKTYPYKGMFWRTSNKKAWLARRSGVTNPRRRKEIDAAAWGYIRHGNRHCRRLYEKMSGISFVKLGITKAEMKDRHGRRIIDANILSMPVVVGKPVTVLDVVDGVETRHGSGRVALLVDFCGMQGKLIVNAPFKTPLVELWSKGVTKIQTVFIDRGGKHYDMDMERTELLEVNERSVMLSGNSLAYEDTGELVIINI